MNGLSTSIIGRAMANELLTIEAVNIRDFAENKHNRVDDYTYGGGAGMLMQAGPVYGAYRSVAEKAKSKPRVIYLSPQGKTFSQSMAEEFAQEEELIFLCGHYEGIDERVLEEIVTDYVSIGDYVLTGGELPAMVMIDAVSRLIPGVLHNDTSAEFESFQDNLLEYPQYTRPEGNRERIQVFEGTVLKKQGGSTRATFTVRKNSNGVGVEKTWPLHSPNVEKVEVIRKGKVRRAKLNYLRGRVGKRAKVKELVK